MLMHSANSERYVHTFRDRSNFSGTINVTYRYLAGIPLPRKSRCFCQELSALNIQYCAKALGGKGSEGVGAFTIPFFCSNIEGMTVVLWVVRCLTQGGWWVWFQTWEVDI